MQADEIIRYVLSFLGGGVVSAVVNWIQSGRSAQRAREVDTLRDQLRLLYGPLFFLTNQNERLFELADAVRSASSDHFEGKNWSQDPQTEAALEKQILATIDVGNTYIKRVLQNSERVMALLEANWHLADAADIETLSPFQVDYTRHQVEMSAKDVPFSVRLKLGHVVFMRPEMMSGVRATFERKKARMGELTGSPWIS